MVGSCFYQLARAKSFTRPEVRSSSTLTSRWPFNRGQCMLSDGGHAGHRHPDPGLRARAAIRRSCGDILTFLADQESPGHVAGRVGVTLRWLRPMLSAQGRGRRYREDFPNGALLSLA